MYKLENFGVTQGYSIAWNELEKIIDTVYEDRDDGWVYKCSYGNWSKENMNRTYIEINVYKSGRYESAISLGYYDNVNSRYIITDYRRKIIDVVAAYQKKCIS